MVFRTVVDAYELESHLDDARWVVLDCRHTLADFALGRRQYDEGHIRGAYFADVENDLAGAKTGKNGRHPLPNPEEFASFLRDCGVSDETQLVAYDAGGDMFAARLWLLSRWIGHEAVAVLDGGLRAWADAGQALTQEPSIAKTRGTLAVRQNPEIIVDAAFVAERLNDPSVHVVDARAADRFAGENETIDPVAGHIPGARNRPFKENFADDSRLKSGDELRSRFHSFGDPQAVVHHCGSGVSAAANMLAMEHAGLHGSRVYAGSWSEWIADPKRPIATGER